MANILLIDDDPVLLKLYSTRLTADGHQVETANNGETAIELLSTFSPQLIVADLLMPKLNGFSFLEYLNSQPKYASIIKIVFSSVVNDEQISRLSSLGVSKYLNKTDTTPTQLVEVIKSFLPQAAAPAAAPVEPAQAPAAAAPTQPTAIPTSTPVPTSVPPAAPSATQPATPTTPASPQQTSAPPTQNNNMDQ